MATKVFQHAKPEPEFNLGTACARQQHGKSPGARCARSGGCASAPASCGRTSTTTMACTTTGASPADKLRFLGRATRTASIRLQCARMVAHRPRQAGVLRDARGPGPAGTADPGGLPRLPPLRRRPTFAGPEALAARCAAAWPIPASPSPRPASAASASPRSRPTSPTATACASSAALARGRGVRARARALPQGRLPVPGDAGAPSGARGADRPPGLDRAADRPARGRRPLDPARLMEDPGRRPPGRQLLAPRQPARRARRRGWPGAPRDPGLRPRAARARAPSRGGRPLKGAVLPEWPALRRSASRRPGCFPGCACRPGTSR